MSEEDYLKYYIHGSDHYLIPKDEFIELLDEMINWKNEAINLKQALNEIREYVDNYASDDECTIKYYRSNLGSFDFKDDLNRILQIIDKVLGEDEE